MSIHDLCLVCHYEQTPLHHGRQFLEESLGSLCSRLYVFGKYDILKQLIWLRYWDLKSNSTFLALIEINFNIEKKITFVIGDVVYRLVESDC